MNQVLAISHEHRHRLFRDFEMHRHHANRDEGGVAFAPEIDFSKKTRESMGFYGSSALPESKPSMRHAASRGRGAVKADNIANKLNHAELRGLLQSNRVLR